MARETQIILKILIHLTRNIFHATGRTMMGDERKSSIKFTSEQIAESVEVSTRTVRRWIAEGLLVAHRINGLVRISEADFPAFLAAHRG